MAPKTVNQEKRSAIDKEALKFVNVPEVLRAETVELERIGVEAEAMRVAAPQRLVDFRTQVHGSTGPCLPKPHHMHWLHMTLCNADCAVLAMLYCPD